MTQVQEDSDLGASPPSCITPRIQNARFGCGDCGRKWTGYVECHCPTCHQHFTHVDNFDGHRIFAGLKGDWSSRRCLAEDEIARLAKANGKFIYTASQGPFGASWARSA